MKYIIPYILCLMALLPPTYGQQSGSQNFILSRIFKQTGADENNVSLVNINVQYMDGLGRLTWFRFGLHFCGLV